MKETVDGKSRFKKLTWENKDGADTNGTEMKRVYCYDATTGKITQTLTKDDGTVVD